jgi:hypothetical protein
MIDLISIYRKNFLFWLEIVCILASCWHTDVGSVRGESFYDRDVVAQWHSV